VRLAALALAAAALAAALPAAAQDLRGHGGPVRALAVDGARILSGGLDTRAIRWAGDAPAQIVRGHTGAVTAVLPLPDGFATGGQDGQVILWRDDSPDPVSSRSAHEAPVSALAALPEGIASAGWDGRIRLPDGTAFDAHQGQVTGLVATASGLASIGTDLRLRFWQGTRLIASVDLASPPAALAAEGAGVIVAGADGVLRRATPAGITAERALSERPLPVVALAAGEGLLAAASVSGEVWVIEAADLTLRARIETGQGAVWAVAFAEGAVLSAGNDGLIRRWTPDGAPLGGGTPTDATAASAPDPDPGARVWRACAVCHSLEPDDGNRAGPTLYGIFGRPIATAPGYAYSEALRALDIVWTEETVAALFEFGPEAYTPGSRMPEQRLPAPEDRRALIEYLRANGG
jgi:cytochrome c